MPSDNQALWHSIAALSPDTAAGTLARWQQQEAEARRQLLQAGVARPEQLQGLSGLQVFEGISKGELPYPHVSEGADIWPIEYEAGRFVFQGHPPQRFLNPMGTLHGGWIATMLDSAVGCAVHTTLPAGVAYTTAELKISYLRALTLKVPLVRAEGRVINTGRQLGFAEGRLYGPDGKLYAHATTTCLVMTPSAG
ncbi:PaaI family thioesterase [Ideonella azotifigens]|uniref:PaaI family thioesterase n=1 Tax=Ideonella azotifigens TaxID=513160 RepID=A0ABN1KEL6_9BURK|nr:PaaI family thioesterase [Ideonella azotifigens]MCD2340744.1 PaaI family thioesterase [Ideonella azotifigens]